MDGIAAPIALGMVALVFFIAERSLSLFSWSRLEELSVPRSRRQAVERCLEDRELVITCFFVLGVTAVATVITLFALRLSIGSGEQTWHVALYTALIVFLVTWILPELAAWRLRDKVVTYLVPPLYRVLGVPFRALRGLIVQPGPQPNGESATADGEPGNDAPLMDAEAHEFFRMAVKIQHMPVREIMTPRTDMVGVPDTASLQRVVDLSQETGYSRFPVYRSNRDQIIGVLHVKDLLAVAGSEKWEETKLADLVRPPFFVPETKTISDLMEEFLRSKTHIGIVLDEYGGTAGLVTLEDMVEELIGEIHDEYEKAEQEAPLVTWIDGRSAEVQAVMHLEEFNEAFNLDLPEEEDFDTLGGFVTYVLGKIPAEGESFQVGDAQFTVLRADARHVIRMRVNLEQEPKPREKV